MKTTQIRVTNIGSDQAEINFKDIINEEDLTGKGIRYAYEGVDGDKSNKKEAYHLRMVSSGVLKSIKKMVSPEIDLKDYKKG